MKDSRIGSTIAALVLFGCAASGPTAKSPFALVEGKRVGALELVVDEEKGWTQKTRDSIKFDNRYMHNNPRIGFKERGESIVFMKVYDGGKLVKTCDEGSFTKNTSSGFAGGGGGHWSMGAGGKMVYSPSFGGSAAPSEEYGVKYNLECGIAALKDGMTIELHDGDGMISKYKVIVQAR